MKKILVSILIVLAIPLVTFASWYNPFTWFPKPIVTTPQAAPAVSQETPQPQIITNVKTITVADPKLQQQIDDLTKQENLYISQVNDLNTKNAELQTENTSLTTQNQGLISENADLNQRITALSNLVDQPVVQAPTVIPSTFDVTLPTGNVYWNTPFKVTVYATQNGQPVNTQVTVATNNGISSDYDSSNVMVTLPYNMPTFTISALGITKNITVSNVASNL